jgi:hypothetical protein
MPGPRRLKAAYLEESIYDQSRGKDKNYRSSFEIKNG